MKNPLVVGYKGEIGRFILQGLLRTMPKALHISCFDVDEDLTECEERIKISDVIFLCVPLWYTKEFFRKWHKQLQGKTVIEQTSLKYLLFEDKKAKRFLKGIDVLSMHILFRPSATPNREDRTVAFIDNPKWNKLYQPVQNIIDSTDFFHYSTYKIHDKHMALQQTLVHRVLLTLDKCLGEDDGTFMSRKVQELVARIKNGDPNLYGAIQNSPYAEKEVMEFMNELNFFDFEDYRWITK